MKKSLGVIFIFIITVSFFSGNVYGTQREYSKVKAQVLSVEAENDQESQVQIVEVKVLQGELKGKQLRFTYQPIALSEYNIALKKNTKIFIQLTIEDNKLVGVSFVDVVRDGPLILLVTLFFLLIILFGGFKGFRSFISLLITGLFIFKLYLPMILKGYSFIFTTVLICCGIILISFILIDGFTRKSFSAILGTIGGTLFSGLLALYFGNKIYLNGLSDETIHMLITQTNLTIDYTGLLYSGITIGVLGAIMDVSMTITSVIYEIKRSNTAVSITSLMLSGLAVGKDIMATMTNTLILAYAGTSLPLLFFLTLSDMSIMGAINSQFIATEILRALCGSIGLILTIPVTSFIAAINS